MFLTEPAFTEQTKREREREREKERKRERETGRKFENTFPG